MNKNVTPILFADNTSLILKGCNHAELNEIMMTTYNNVKTWFMINSLSIDIEKTHYILFKAKNKPTFDVNIVSDNKLITPVSDTKLLDIYLQDSLNWNNHIQHIIPKLSSACYIMRRLKPIMPINTITIAYYSYFNAVMTYGLSFWGNSPHSIKIFTLQKKAVRIIMGNNSRASCRNLFKRLCILPLPSQYILSIVLFVV